MNLAIDASVDKNDDGAFRAGGTGGPGIELCDRMTCRLGRSQPGEQIAKHGQSPERLNSKIHFSHA